MASMEKHSFDSTDSSEEAKPNAATAKNAEDPVFEPEPDNPEMLIKPTCECQNCLHWTQSADWSTPDLHFGDHHKNVCKERKIHPLLRSSKHPRKTPKIFTFNPGNLTKVEKQGLLKTLVHGEVIPQPVGKLSDTYFNNDIQLALKGLNYKYSLPIQSFVWPAIFRQMNVFMIGSPKSGKTMAYLPAICTFSTMQETKYLQLSKHKGPLIVIICPNSQHCEQIYDLMKKLYNNIQMKPKISIMTYPVGHVNNVDILITIPNSLLHCLKTRIFSLKRLCHLVLEDASCLLKDNESSLRKILEVVDEMLEHRMSNAQVQLIVSSKKWTTDLQKLLKSIYITPLVCIGNYLEAALYGNIQFEVKFLMSEQKKTYLEGILRDKSHLFKTIVICNNDEITEVNKWLVRNGIDVMALSEKSSREEIEEREREWAFSKGGQYKVLLCTDFVFDSLLYITDAMWLINYSLSETWTRFLKRFSALSSYYKSPWESSEDSVKSKCFLMIDETCEKQMGKILNLLNRLSKDLPPSYQEYADAFKKKHEGEKIDNCVELCKTLKLFGKCGDPMCDNRHLVCEQLDVSEHFPKSGKLVFKILSMKDVTHYAVQVIKFIDLDGNVKEVNNDDLKKPLIYKSGDEKKRAKDIKVGMFYAHCDHNTDGEEFMLCHVLNIENETFVEVKLSKGVARQTLLNKLYELPSHLEIVDIYMANLTPPFKDEMFSGRAFHLTRTSLEAVEYKNMVLTGDIYLQLDKSFWLQNVAQIVKVDGFDVVKFNLTKHLINMKVVEASKTQVSNLHKLCEKCDINLPCYVKYMAKKAKTKEVEAQRAWLNDIHEVILSSGVSPEEFYVRLAKFQPLLEDLEKDIQDAVETKILDKNINVEVGKYCLAPDPNTQRYSRALILKTENSKALCFFVDYGDEAVFDFSELKTLPSKFITKLPFQAIQCRLYGLCPAFGEWDDAATDVLYKYMLEPDSDVFRSLFVMVMNQDKCETIRAKTTYSVLMKDGFGDKNVLINQLLLDCGFATSIFEKIEDFEIPKVAVVSESSDSDSEINLEGDAIEEENEPNLEEMFGEDFDLEVLDAEEFLELLGVRRPNSSPQITSNNTENNDNQNTSTEFNNFSESIRNEGAPTFLTPEVYWSQTDKTVRLKIKLIGVENYKTNVIQRRIFTFSTVLDEKKYELKFTLHKPVEIEKHHALGQEVLVVLKKITLGEWLQLTGTQKRMRYIHYEVPDTEEKKLKRKFLQLDITDDESDENDGEKPMIHEISDLDSDFDEEVYSSSSD